MYTARITVRRLWKRHRSGQAAVPFQPAKKINAGTLAHPGGDYEERTLLAVLDRTSADQPVPRRLQSERGRNGPHSHAAPDPHPDNLRRAARRHRHRCQARGPGGTGRDQQRDLRHGRARGPRVCPAEREGDQGPAAGGSDRAGGPGKTGRGNPPRGAQGGDRSGNRAATARQIQSRRACPPTTSGSSS